VEHNPRVCKLIAVYRAVNVGTIRRMANRLAAGTGANGCPFGGGFKFEVQHPRLTL
jgi:hypothetical protein